MKWKYVLLLGLIGAACFLEGNNLDFHVLISNLLHTGVHCKEEEDDDEELPPTVDADLGSSRDALKTDDETVQK